MIISYNDFKSEQPLRIHLLIYYWLSSVSYVTLPLQGAEGDRAIEMALKNPKKFVLKTMREAAGMN